MKLHILGCHAAAPGKFTNPSSQVLEIRNHLFLIDCGEGTQVELRKNKIKFSRVNHIFISHLHGDHFFGLPGLISTFRLLGREKELHIYGPKGIKEAMTLLFKLGKSWTNFPLLFHEISSNDTETIFEDEKVSVETVPLDHRVYTNGFLFREKPQDRKLKVKAAVDRGIDKAYFQRIKSGKDIQMEDGSIIPNAELTLDPPPAKSYAYCSDTAYLPALAKNIEGVSALYHESTFLESESHLAEKTRHSTARQAARIAMEAKVGLLILGHYSGRYKSTQLFKDEALKIFPRVELAEDGKLFEI